MVSRDFARIVVNKFFPLAMPIDWHVQGLFMYKRDLKAYWALNTVFRHGSEEGVYKSWREDVR